MSPITFEEALAATDPNLDDTDKGPDGLTARGRSAQAIMNGVRANEVYWDHRPDLEALRARVEGHGVVQRGGESEDANPTQVGPGANPNLAPQDNPAIEGTATEEPTPAVPAATPAAPAPVPSPDNPNDAIARLRAQVETLGGTPEA